MRCAEIGLGEAVAAVRRVVAAHLGASHPVSFGTPLGSAVYSVLAAAVAPRHSLSSSCSAHPPLCSVHFHYYHPSHSAAAAAAPVVGVRRWETRTRLV